MKKFLALALALVMVVGLLPAAVMTVTAATTYVDFSTVTPGNTGGATDKVFDVTTDKYTATLEDTYTNTAGEIDSLMINGLFASMSEPHLTQTIKIDDMPIIPEPSVSGNYYKYSGYFNTLHRNNRKDPTNTAVTVADYLLYAVYRKNAAGDLGLQVLEHSYTLNGNNVVPKLETRIDVPLNKKLGDEFQLTTVWHSDNSASFYCDGVKLGTCVDATSTLKQYGSTNWLWFGLFGGAALGDTALLSAYGDADNDGVGDYDGTVKMSISNMSVTDGHVAGEVADCTQDIKCVCGEVVAQGAEDHTYNRKVSTSAYAKEGAAGVFYTSCSVCGTSSKGTAKEATFTAVDISGGTKSDYYTLDGNYAVTLYRDNYTYAQNGTTDLDNFTLDNLTKDLTEVHLSQTITIDNMTKFDKTVISGNYYQHSGFYNVFFRNRRYIDPEDTSSQRIADYLMYTIQRRDNDGSLYLILAYSPESSMNTSNYTPSFTYNAAVALGKKLGETFRLTTVWNEDNSVDFYIDGDHLVSYEAAKALTVQKSTGASVEYFRFGYYDTYPVETGYESTAKMTVSALTVNDGCIAEDDGDCTTAVVCPECGETVTAAKTHVAAEDDGDCTTAVLCKNTGCEHEFVEAKSHVPGQDDGNCETPIACTNTGCTQNAVAAKTHVAGQDDGDCTTPVACTNTGCTQNAIAGKTHVAGEDDGDCTTPVACTNPGCTQNAVAAKTHVAGEDDGDCTTPVACTNPGCTQNAVAAKTHVAGQDDGDCTTPVACTNPGCTQNAVAAKTHTGGTATCEKKAECTNCGKEYGELAAHKPGDNGDCITGFTCTVCGEPVAATGSHTPAADDGDCTTAIKCTVCGKETTAAKSAHTPAEDDGDCTTAIKCTVCGTVTTAAKNAHTPAEDDGDCTTAIKCTVCGKETTAAKNAHTPAEDDGDCTTAIKCTVCGTVTTAAKSAHTEKVVNAKPATATEKGYTGDKVCSVCGKEIAKGQEIPVLEPAPTTPPATEPSTPDAPIVNPDTGDNGTAVYALLLAVSMMAMVALMVPDIRNKLIRK